MPRKPKTKYVCQSCGYEAPAWLGRCPECGSWGAFVEEKITEGEVSKRAKLGPSPQPIPLSQVRAEPQVRLNTQSNEFDRVLGGGIVPGSLVLIGGDPGIGKSTLLLQRCADLSKRGLKVLYVSGEESIPQTKLRAERLGINSDNLWVLSEIDMNFVLEKIEELSPQVVVIDSIQTMYKPEFESAPGSITQVRECALSLMHVAKGKGVPVFLVGHVTKEGAIAGPRTLEHMVDTLLYFEGDRHHYYRILRAVKNRFGSTNELGVFEMREKGLVEVSNPSEMFLSGRRGDIPGSAVICTIEGTRPIMVEIQALTSPASYGVPQRTASGMDHRRLSLLLAVLEKRVGLRLGNYDVFLKVAGGMRTDEPASDLGVVASIASSFRDKTLDPKAVVVGEVGLGGEVRSVAQIEKRISEAERLGFQRILVPKENLKGLQQRGMKIEVRGVERVKEALEVLMM